MCTDAVRRLLEATLQDPDVLAALEFGSTSRGEATAESDRDICLVIGTRRATEPAMSRKRLAYLSSAPTTIDIHIFQQLPIYVRHRVLRDGVLLQCKDEDLLYDLAFRTAQEYDDFRHIYTEYLDEVAHG